MRRIPVKTRYERPARRPYGNLESPRPARSACKESSCAARQRRQMRYLVFATGRGLLRHRAPINGVGDGVGARTSFGSATARRATTWGRPYGGPGGGSSDELKSGGRARSGATGAAAASAHLVPYSVKTYDYSIVRRQGLRLPPTISQARQQGQHDGPRSIETVRPSLRVADHCLESLRVRSRRDSARRANEPQIHLDSAIVPSRHDALRQPALRSVDEIRARITDDASSQDRAKRSIEPQHRRRRRSASSRFMTGFDDLRVLVSASSPRVHLRGDAREGGMFRLQTRR
jgi:hypothetical protein